MPLLAAAGSWLAISSLLIPWCQRQILAFLLVVKCSVKHQTMRRCCIRAPFYCSYGENGVSCEQILSLAVTMCVGHVIDVPASLCRVVHAGRIDVYNP